jgi:hypothetical protein
MRSKLAIALGGIIACLVTMPIDAFVAPSPMLRSTVPVTGFGVDQLRMVKLPDFRAVSEILVPSIPKQEAPINRLSDQFRPRFVAKEFLVGVRYMLRMYTLLIACSLLCTIIRIYLPLPETTVEFGRSSLGACHQLEGRAKLIAANTLKFSMVEIPQWFTVSFVPFLEEMSYRGFGHMVGRFRAVLDLLPFAGLCRWGPVPATAWCGVSAFISIEALLVAVKEKTISSASIALGDLSEVALLLPAQVFIINMLRKQKEKASKAEDSSTVINVTSEQRKNAVNMITTLALGKETKAPVELERKLEHCFSRSARFLGAREFGAAHAVVKGGLPLREALRYLQKGFGTFVSSLLIESRLVVNRRNIWGAVGAHVAFNSISGSYFFRGLQNLAVVTGPAAEMPLSLRFFRLSLTLLILQKGLEFLCNILQNVEDLYLS